MADESTDRDSPTGRAPAPQNNGDAAGGESGEGDDELAWLRERFGPEQQSNLSKMVSFRVRPEDHENIKEKADAVGISVAAYLRHLATGARPDVEAVSHILSALGREGVALIEQAKRLREEAPEELQPLAEEHVEEVQVLIEQIGEAYEVISHGKRGEHDQRPGVG